LSRSVKSDLPFLNSNNNSQSNFRLSTEVFFTNSVSVSGGGEANLANDTAADITTISTFTFTITATSTPTTTVRAGQTAPFNLTVTPAGGAITIPVTLAGSTTAALTAIAVLPTQVTTGTNPVLISVTAETTSGLGSLSRQAPSKSAPVAAILFPFALIVLTGLGASKYKKNKKFRGWIALILVLSFLGMGVMGCVGAQNNFQHPGTSPGTYSITVTASVASTPQTLNLTLIVQP